MARIIWSPEALAQLGYVVEYIQLFDPAAARRIADRVLSLGESLATFPNRGRPAAHGLRELVTIRPYILRYDVDQDVVTILGVRHGAQLADD